MKIVSKALKMIYSTKKKRAFDEHHALIQYIFACMYQMNILKSYPYFYCSPLLLF